jgi:hypothetical protein
MAGTPLSKRLSVAERRRLAIEMKLRGMTWQAIADSLGYRGGRAAVAVDVNRALEHIIKEPATELVNQEVARLDRMLEGLYPKATKGDARAADTVLRLMERRAKYLGLDKLPPSTEVAVADGRVIIQFASPPIDGSPAAAPTIVELQPDE